MYIAITGGTGFVGRALARELTRAGHRVVLVARGVDQRDAAIRQLDSARFVAASLDDTAQLTQAFAGCDAVAHCAGINREQGAQTYQHVHVEGTRNVVAAAHSAGVRKLVLLSYLHARPDCGSAYHETKWAAEELVRAAGIDHTILKAGMIYGKGDHMLGHISHTLKLLPVFATVGLRERTVRPVAVADVVRILRAALVENRMTNQTVAVLGPEEIDLSIVVRRVAQVMGRRVLVLPMPIVGQQLLAILAERFMPVPLVTRSQIRMLAEGISTPLPGSVAPPHDLIPMIRLDAAQIRAGLPE